MRSNEQIYPPLCWRVQASEAVAELQAENKRLAGLLSEAEVAAEGAAQLRDALEAKNEAEVLQVSFLCLLGQQAPIDLSSTILQVPVSFRKTHMQSRCT